MKLISRSLLTKLSHDAANHPRGRLNLNLHASTEEPVQRMLNALEPDTYVRPHRHTQPPRRELFTVLSGALILLVFDDHGRVQERLELGAQSENLGVELPVGRWHTLIAQLPGTVILEVKQGPYVPLCDDDFASWAPAEGQAGCAGFVDWCRRARPGDTAPITA